MFPSFSVTCRLVSISASFCLEERNFSANCSELSVLFFSNAVVEMCFVTVGGLAGGFGLFKKICNFL